MGIIRKKARIGIVTIGHRLYWSQFPGLEEELKGYGRQFEQIIEGYEVEIVSAGFVDDMATSFTAAEKLKNSDLDLLFCYLSTYVTSAVATGVITNAEVPTVLVALQPRHALDYANTTTYMQLVNDNVCALPEVSGVLLRTGKPAAGMVVGTLNEDPRARRELQEWCRAASVKRAFKRSKIGYLGHTYEGMYDMHSDPTAFTASFGSHVQMLEMCDLAKMVHSATKQQINDKLDEIHSVFEIAEPYIDPITRLVKPEDLEWAAKVAVGMDRLIVEQNLVGMAYYYRGLDGNEYERIASNMTLGNSLLTGKGVPLAGEADLKTCAAMMIMDRLGAGGSFSELHPCDFHDDIVLVGHDGPHHVNISDGRPIIRGLDLFHGKSGSGIGVEFSIKAGPVTLLSISQNQDGSYRLIATEGESIKGAIPRTGNTNTRCNFNRGTAEFVESWCMAGPTHHFALGVGHVNSQLKKTASLMNLELYIV
ncbi:L-fucose/L-arabinose isomerase family protein [Paenibacillus sp. IITD108]|uniref:L-fucose/L-arabinose isomerase family protein n=1 Tax=Paenibacillus sp. IITD108 TaxID=3116649 RepID=UPI002F3E7291